MIGTRFAFAFALLLGLFTVAGCANTGYDRYGRPTYGRTGDIYGRGAYNYPDYARVGGAGANARYRVCHNGRSRVLPAPAVDAHLRHGDYLGSCGSNNRGRYDRWRSGRYDDRRYDRDDDRYRRDRDDDDRRRHRARDRDDDDDDDRRRNRNRGRGNGNGRGRGN